MRPWKWIFAISLVLVVAGYVNCDPTPSNPFHFKGLGAQDTVIGNPFGASMKIVNQTCDVILKAHPELTTVQCQNGLLSTSFSSALGVRPQTLNPFWTLTAAEQAGAVTANPNEVDPCLRSIAQLDPNSPQVSAAYNSQLFNPFLGVAQMIPGDGSRCPNVYKESSFPTPTPSPTPGPGIVIVDFDNPFPPPNLPTIYQGIDFSGGGINWTTPFNADTTNFGFDGMSSGNDLYFSFSGGPKLLLSIGFFLSTTSGNVTIYDDQGQSVSQFVPSDRAMHAIVTNFSKPSNKVYMTTALISHNLGLDDITYKNPDVAPVISQIQSATGGGQVAAIQSRFFNSEVNAGDLIVIQVNWNAGASIQSVTDNIGNLYSQALPVGTALGGNQQQIWYAKNVIGGPTEVTVTLDAPVYCDFSLHEYSGVDKISPVDVSSSESGYGWAADSGQVVTHFANELVFGGIYSDDHIVKSIGPGFVWRTTTYQSNIAEDQMTTQVGSFSASANIGWDGNWIAQIVTFRSH